MAELRIFLALPEYGRPVEFDDLRRRVQHRFVVFECAYARVRRENALFPAGRPRRRLVRAIGTAIDESVMA
jgi:hypothetical protein